MCALTIQSERGTLRSAPDAHALFPLSFKYCMYNPLRPGGIAVCQKSLLTAVRWFEITIYMFRRHLRCCGKRKHVSAPGVNDRTLDPRYVHLHDS